MQLDATVVQERELVVTTQPLDPSYARLDERVTGLERSVKGIETGIGELAKKFDERSRTPWAVLLTGAAIIITLVGVIGTAWKAPIDGMLVRQEMDLREIRSSIVPRVEIDNLRSATARERDDIRARIDRIEDALFVPRTGE